MSDVNQLEQQLREKLASAKRRAQDYQTRLRERMAENEQISQRFQKIADRVFESIVRPRMDKLAGMLDNAEILKPDQGLPYHCVCRFAHTIAFPATTTLNLSVCHDERIENLVAVYNLEILPVLFQFEGHDQKSFPLDELDEEQLAAWVDEKLLSFMDTYLRLEADDQYQKHNLVTDPVCGMEIKKAFAVAQLELQGHTYYFCAEECKREFAEDPQRYLPKRWGKAQPTEQDSGSGSV